MASEVRGIKCVSASVPEVLVPVVKQIAIKYCSKRNIRKNGIPVPWVYKIISGNISDAEILAECERYVIDNPKSVIPFRYGHRGEELQPAGVTRGIPMRTTSVPLEVANRVTDMRNQFNSMHGHNTIAMTNTHMYLIIFGAFSEEQVFLFIDAYIRANPTMTDNPRKVYVKSR